MLGRAIRDSWPLFVGMLLLMLSNGLLVTLLTVRGSALGFSNLEIGIMQAGYPVGALLGCLVAPRIVASVGHARAFGALASLCSIAALVHLVTDDTISWTAMRVLAGFCFPGLYVVAESWLNARASNDTRATLLGLYFVVQVGGAALGQMLLSLPDDSGSMLFVLSSILVSLALVPMLLSPTQAGDFVAPERISIGRLFRLSPFGFIGCFLNGIAQGLVYVGLGLYGAAIGLADGTVGLLVATVAVGAAVSQFPVGALSDRMDRRLVILGLAVLALVPCAYLSTLSDAADLTPVTFVVIAAMGALVVPIYGLCVAHTNDRLTPQQIVPAAGALVLVLNAGVIFGPMAASAAITLGGPGALFIVMGAVQAATAITAFLRIGLGRTQATETRAASPISYTATGYAANLNPDAERSDTRQPD